MKAKPKTPTLKILAFSLVALAAIPTVGAAQQAGSAIFRWGEVRLARTTNWDDFR